VKKRFKAKLGNEEEASLFEVPFDPKEAFGATKAKVKVTLNAHAYRSTICVYGGRFYIPVRKSNRDAAGIEVGDIVDVLLELDTEPRVVELPAPLAKALAKSPRAKAAWDKLSYTHRKEHAEAIAGAKRPETVEARVKKAMEMLLSKASAASTVRSPSPRKAK
jgi:Bacteriocin-protection, YdeI or OmpD-Associated/Domain of unknown function (DUF1905)